MSEYNNDESVKQRECDLRHTPIEKTLSRLENRLNWFYIIIIITLISTLVNLGISVVNPIQDVSARGYSNADEN